MTVKSLVMCDHHDAASGADTTSLSPPALGESVEVILVPPPRVLPQPVPPSSLTSGPSDTVHSVVYNSDSPGINTANLLACPLETPSTVLRASMGNGVGGFAVRTTVLE